MTSAAVNLVSKLRLCRGGRLALMFGFLFLFNASAADARPPEPTVTLRQDQPLLIPQIGASRHQIVFAYAGDIWLVARAGGVARQLTRGPDDDGYPVFCPEGKHVAFSRTVNGSGADIYTIAISGGEPVRLTYHPAPDIVRAWSPDGRRVLFSSARGTTWERRLYTVAAEGGPALALPIAQATDGVYSRDGARLIYSPAEPIPGGYATSWRSYRGGLVGRLVSAHLLTGRFTQLSATTASDRSPAWAGETLIIISDRDRATFNLFALDPVSGATRQLTRFDDFGVEAVADSPDPSVVFVRDGHIHDLDLRSGSIRRVPLEIRREAPERALRTVPAAKWLQGSSVEAAGRYAAFQVRGDILLMDRTAGRTHNVTASSGANDRAPALSPGGRRIAYFSDAAGDEDLYVANAAGPGAAKRIRLPKERAGFAELTWSPDEKSVSFSDTRAGLWMADVRSGAVKRVATGQNVAQEFFYPTWSADGRWLAYAKQLSNNNHALFIYDRIQEVSTQLSDGRVDASRPAFGPEGEYLYFVTSSNVALEHPLGMYSTLFAPLVVRELRAIVLHADGINPFSTAASSRTVGVPARPLTDISRLRDRIWTAPVSRRDFQRIIPTRTGSLLLAIRDWPSTPGGNEPVEALYRYQPGGSELMKTVSGGEMSSAAHGEALLYREGDQVRLLREGIAESSEVDLGATRLEIDPSQEWRQIYGEAWRVARARFYDPNYHGQNAAALERHYAAFLPGITRRTDLNVLLAQAIGHLSVSHLSISGGDLPTPLGAMQRVGTLGAEFDVDGGRYRFSRIRRSDPLTQSSDAARSPFDAPGAGVAEGEYLLAVNGEDASPARDVYALLEGTAGKPTLLTVADRAEGGSARTVTVVPLSSDAALRDVEWVEKNRRAVERLSGGKAAYIYLPDFQTEGINSFVRDFVAATDKQALVLDQRWNRGGWLADFFLDLLSRRPSFAYRFRDADDARLPIISNAGPKVLIVNERNGSAAETFAYLFQQSGLGKLIGARTAGAAVGHWYGTTLMDGGNLLIPMRAFFNPAGTWDIEARGVQPDVELHNELRTSPEGRDLQLEGAVRAVLDELKRHPAVEPRHPLPPVFPTIRR